MMQKIFAVFLALNLWVEAGEESSTASFDTAVKSTSAPAHDDAVDESKNTGDSHSLSYASMKNDIVREFKKLHQFESKEVKKLERLSKSVAQKDLLKEYKRQVHAIERIVKAAKKVEGKALRDYQRQIKDIKREIKSIKKSYEKKTGNEKCIVLQNHMDDLQSKIDQQNDKIKSAKSKNYDTNRPNDYNELILPYNNFVNKFNDNVDEYNRKHCAEHSSNGTNYTVINKKDLSRAVVRS